MKKVSSAAMKGSLRKDDRLDGQTLARPAKIDSQLLCHAVTVLGHGWVGESHSRASFSRSNSSTSPIFSPIRFSFRASPWISISARRLTS